MKSFQFSLNKIIWLQYYGIKVLLSSDATTCLELRWIWNKFISSAQYNMSEIYLLPLKWLDFLAIPEVEQRVAKVDQSCYRKLAITTAGMSTFVTMTG